MLLRTVEEVNKLIRKINSNIYTCILLMDVSKINKWEKLTFSKLLTFLSCFLKI